MKPGKLWKHYCKFMQYDWLVKGTIEINPKATYGVSRYLTARLIYDAQNCTVQQNGKEKVWSNRRRTTESFRCLRNILRKYQIGRSYSRVYQEEK